MNLMPGYVLSQWVQSTPRPTQTKDLGALPISAVES